jgi:hypothetical protein
MLETEIRHALETRRKRLRMADKQHTAYQQMRSTIELETRPSKISQALNNFAHAFLKGMAMH